MATRAAAAACLRAAGVPARGGSRMGVRAVEGSNDHGLVRSADTCGGRRSFLSFLGKGPKRITEVPPPKLIQEPKQHVIVESAISEGANQTYKISHLELELKMEKALSQQRIYYEDRLRAVQKESEDKVNLVKATVDVNQNKIREVEMTTKLLSQRLDQVEKSWGGRLEIVRYNVVKTAGGVVTAIVGSVVASLKIAEFMKLPATRLKSVKGNPMTMFTGKDWFD